MPAAEPDVRGLSAAGTKPARLDAGAALWYSLGPFGRLRSGFIAAGPLATLLPQFCQGPLTLLRAIVAFLAFPGLIAFAIPISAGIVTHRPAQHEALAFALILLGTAALGWCVREFYVAGRGTLAPWARPKRLVTSGPYRYSRNPMYVSTMTILLGWCVLWDSPGLHIHTVITLLVVIARVCFLEEVLVQRHFGSEWERYRARTPRWLIPVRRAQGAAATARRET